MTPNKSAFCCNKNPLLSFRKLLFVFFLKPLIFSLFGASFNSPILFIDVILLYKTEASLPHTHTLQMSGNSPIDTTTTMATSTTEPDVDYYECMCSATAKMPGYGKALNCCANRGRGRGRGFRRAFGQDWKRPTFGQELPSYRCRGQRCPLAEARAEALAEQTNSLAPSTVDLGWRRELPPWCPYAKEKRVWKKIASEADAVAEITNAAADVPAEIIEKQDGLKAIPAGARQTILVFLRSHPRPTPQLVRSFAAESGIDPTLFAQYLASVKTKPASPGK